MNHALLAYRTWWALWLVTAVPLLSGLIWIGAPVVPRWPEPAGRLDGLALWALFNIWVFLTPFILIVWRLRSKTPGDVTNAEN
jgi:hypothetical protein